MTKEGNPRTPEDEAVLSEIRLGIERMRVHTNRPGADRGSNLFRQTIQRNIIGVEEVTGYRDFYRAGGLLTALKLPQMSIGYRRTTKKDQIPDVPEELFDLLSNNERVLGRYGIDEVDVARTGESFNKMRDALEGQIPSFWAVAQTMDVWFRGHRIDSVDIIDRIIRKEWPSGSIIPRIITRGAVLGYILANVLKVYTHPGTLKSFDGILVKEDRIFRQHGINLPTTMEVSINEQA